MQRALITGSNRGLGLEFVKQLLARGAQVFAACRQPEQAKDLKALQVEYPDMLTLVKLEVTDQDEIAAAVETVRAAVDGLDLLINNAGINQDGEGFGSLEADAMLEVLRVNSIAPVMVTQAFAGMLAKGQKPKVVNLSSQLGSIERAGGGHHSYAASKAALNMFTKILSANLRGRGVTAIVIDPGWVQTDMGGRGAPLEPPESIGGMLQVIDGLSLSDAGRYLRYSGEEVPW
jgi:NAD(P)-dependent dehydrogenase (short-subunit alcohol dehydrogenase family)